MKLFENIYAASKKPNSDNCNQICLPAALVLGQAIPFNFHDKPFQLEMPRNYFSATSSSAKRLQLGRPTSRLPPSISHRQLISNRVSLRNQVTTTVRLPPPTTAPPHVKFYVNCK